MKALITQSGQFGPFSTIERTEADDGWHCDKTEVEGSGVIYPDGAIGDATVGDYIAPPPPPPPVPESVTPRQFREALIDSDLFDAVDGAVAASGDRKLQNWWEFTTAFERNHHLIAPLAESLGVTDAQLDALWVLAGSL